MTGIYDMTMTVNFLLQATRVLHVGNYDEDELIMIFNFMTAIDDKVLYEYLCTNTLVSYNNDLELYVEIVDVMIDVFENREEYEKCGILKFRRDNAINMINSKIK